MLHLAETRTIMILMMVVGMTYRASPRPGPSSQRPQLVALLAHESRTMKVYEAQGEHICPRIATLFRSEGTRLNSSHWE